MRSDILLPCWIPCCAPCWLDTKARWMQVFEDLHTNILLCITQDLFLAYFIVQKTRQYSLLALELCAKAFTSTYKSRRLESRAMAPVQPEIALTADAVSLDFGVADGCDLVAAEAEGATASVVAVELGR